MDWWVAVWGPIVVAVVLWVLKEVVALRRDLVKHMGNEETLRAGDLAQREDTDKREEGKQHMLWGVIGMFIMMAVFTIMRILANTLGSSVTLPHG